MSGKPAFDRRSERRQETIEEIVDAAWSLARTHGLAELSLRDLAGAVGMRPQSLYTYFDSKNAIYDAMFARGAAQYAQGQSALPMSGTAREYLTALIRHFADFCTADPARYHLLFQRIVPGFEPSPESFAISAESLAAIGEQMAALGITHPHALDLMTAIGTGLVDQQMSNDPGGDRWLRLIDDAVDMFLDYVTKTTDPKGAEDEHDHR